MLNKFREQLENKGEIYLKIKVRPGAGKTEIVGILDDDTIKINIAASSVKGKANQELVRFLGEEFGVGKDSIKIISGAGERVKVVKIFNSQ